MNTSNSGNCPCDSWVFPKPLIIPAGLTALPRQIGMFGEFRKAMLRSIPGYPALFGWQAQGEEDLGVMLLEMWAYICDNLSFYDKLAADEAYLSTAKLRSSLRKLVGLLGYIPRPATASQAIVAAWAEGFKEIVIPQGVGLRSGAFDPEAPQVFEVDADTSIHPLHTQWHLPVPPPGTAAESYAASQGLASAGELDSIPLETLTFDTASTIRTGDILVVTVQSDADFFESVRVQQVSEVTAANGETFKSVALDRILDFAPSVEWDDVEIESPTQTTSLWTNEIHDDHVVIDGATITLSGLVRQIMSGDTVVLTRNGDPPRPFFVDAVSETSLTLIESKSYEAVDAEEESVTLYTPSIYIPVTQVTLDANVNDPSRTNGGTDWTADQAGQITVHYATRDVDPPTALPFSNYSTAAGGTFGVESSHAHLFTALGEHEFPNRFLIEDQLKNSAEVTGALDPNTLTLALGPLAGGPQLIPPLTAYGNIMPASRGETVSAEVLGSGDASVAHQTFTLKKKPLTYRSDPAAPGGAITDLTVRVNGIEWQAVANFFNSGPDDRVYIVRQNDDQESIITFGDSIRGSRLETGTDNIIATYRFGAGQAAPPAGVLNQLAKPYKGLTRVTNPTPAYGGSDDESEAVLRTQAPKSALLLGRAVSLVDFEAAAASIGGVVAAKATWQWHAVRQQRTVHIAYIGDSQLAPTITASIRAMAEINIPLSAEVATVVPLTMALDVLIDNAYVSADVIDAIQAALVDNTDGMLALQNIGIGAPLYHSHVVGTIMDVAGVVSVTGLTVNDSPLPLPGMSPGDNAFFEVASGMLIINGVTRTWI